ncbi:MAG TPA: hypothetical protein VMB47_02470 [Candidatus Aquilonibacter sp.]|nr:hypothetical protein [Candidatus Aquilonibacter sp.]
MRKIELLVASILALACIVWAGGDPWKTKTPDQWTEKDIQQILQTSPWVRPNLQVAGARNSDTAPMTGGNIGIAGSKTDSSRASTGATPNKLGGAEKEADALAAQASYTVFWWSSRTIRAASMRRAVLKGTMTQEDADKAVANQPDDYMILVQATNMAIFQQRGEDGFAKAAFLEPKRLKDKLYPTKVSFLKGSDGQTVTGAIFYFSKKSASGEPTIASDEKEVDFYLEVGPSKISTYFDPRKMTDSKGEDL